MLSLYNSSYHSHFSYIIVIIIPTWPEAVASNPSSLAQGRCVESNCPPSRRMNQPNCPPSRRMNQPTGQRPLRRIRVPWPGAVASNPRTRGRDPPGQRPCSNNAGNRMRVFFYFFKPGKWSDRRSILPQQNQEDDADVLGTRCPSSIDSLTPRAVDAFP